MSPFFFVFKFLHTNRVYISYITIYVYEGKHCRTKALWVLNFRKFETRPQKNQILKGTWILNFLLLKVFFCLTMMIWIFFVFKSLHTHIVYRLCIIMYINEGKVFRKYLMGLKI